MAKKKIDYFKTGKAIAMALLEDKNLSVFEDEEHKVKVKIIRFTEDTDTNINQVMTYIRENKNSKDKQKLFVYNGFTPNGKLVTVDKVVKTTTETLLEYNDLELIGS